MKILFSTLLFLLLISCSSQQPTMSAQDWTQTIEETLSNFVYNKENVNYFVTNKEYYDGNLEVVEFKGNKTRSKHSYIVDVGTENERKISKFLTLESDAVYSYVDNPDFDPNDQESEEFIKTRTDLPFIPGQTAPVFLLGPDNIFHGFEERIANYEPMFMDFLMAIKNNFDWVVYKDGRYLVKKDYHDDMWTAYVQRGRKLSMVDMSEIYFVLQDGTVSECGFSALDNGVEVKHIYSFQFGGIDF